MISVQDLFSVGIGPSPSHTVGPMRAAVGFVAGLPQFPARVAVTFHGSLAATARGHGTDRAVILGLAGYTPTALPADVTPAPSAVIPDQGTINGPAGSLDYSLEWFTQALPQHPNGLALTAFDAGGKQLGEPTEYFSVGGGFILTGEQFSERGTKTGIATADRADRVSFPFTTATELLAHCQRENRNFSEITLANERAMSGDDAVLEHLDTVWQTMRECVTNGIAASGTLPGGLEVARRAPALFDALMAQAQGHPTRGAGLDAMEWVNLYALAVNEENAAGGRVVTAPTNGAAGLCEILGGSPAQVENAAEIALEHNLGLTCDPVGGLVQIPCIERNAIGAVKSINPARLACLGEGTNRVTLDDVIRTMAETGRGMMTKYKETSTGGLAVNIGLPVSFTEC